MEQSAPVCLQACLQARPICCKICHCSGHSTEQHIGKKEGSPFSFNKPMSSQSSDQPKTTKGKGKQTNKGKGKGKQWSQNTTEVNTMEVNINSGSSTPLDEIALDIQSINPLAFGEVECIPPASG